MLGVISEGGSNPTGTSHFSESPVILPASDDSRHFPTFLDFKTDEGQVRIVDNAQIHSPSSSSSSSSSTPSPGGKTAVAAVTIFPPVGNLLDSSVPSSSDEAGDYLPTFLMDSELGRDGSGCLKIRPGTGDKKLRRERNTMAVRKCRFKAKVQQIQLMLENQALKDKNKQLQAQNDEYTAVILNMRKIINAVKF